MERTNEQPKGHRGLTSRLKKMMMTTMMNTEHDVLCEIDFNDVTVDFVEAMSRDVYQQQQKAVTQCFAAKFDLTSLRHFLPTYLFTCKLVVL